MPERVTKKELRQKYPTDLKRKIAKAYESGEYSYGFLALEYGLRDHMVVREMVKWYRRQEELVVDGLALESVEMKQNDLELDSEQLRLELDAMRRKLSRMSARARALWPTR